MTCWKHPRSLAPILFGVLAVLALDISSSEGEDGTLFSVGKYRDMHEADRTSLEFVLGAMREAVFYAQHSIGQPVICGGSMETGSYLLVGTSQAMDDTFGSTMHGSGRTMSRAQAKRSVRGEQLKQQMAQRGIIVKAVSMSGLAEEAGLAYKNISEVVESVHEAGITKKVAELRPIGNIKG